MRLFRTAYINLVFLCVYISLFSSVSYCQPPGDRCILLKVQAAGRDDYNILYGMGLDIWAVQEDGVVIQVTDNDRKLIRESGFIVETITEDVYEYLETKRKRQISLFAEQKQAEYHPYSEVVDGLASLESSGIAKTYSIGKTHENRDIWAVKITDNPAVDEGEPGALFMGCHHAREWISVEVPLYLANHLIDNYQTDPQVKHLVDNCEIWIVPVVNPDGYVYTWTKDRLWRKNRRNNGSGSYGVDLNRNYGYMWGLDDGSSGYKGDWDYRGPSPFSEPETRAVRDLILAGRFRMTMSYHSYGQLLYSPWGYTIEVCPDDLPMNSMIYHMKDLILQAGGAVYTPWAEWVDKYPVSGDTGDWPYGVLGIYSLGAELRPETEAGGGFVLPENQILPTCEENLPAALYLISLAAADGGVENLTTGETYGCIQFAVNDANDGDRIVIEPGFYNENILFKGKNLILSSKEPSDPATVEATAIRGNERWPTATFSSGEDESFVLDGLTIINEGQNCITCSGSSPLISRCSIINQNGFALNLHLGSEPGLVDSVIDGAILGPAFFVDDDAPNDPGPGNPDISDPNENGSPEHPFDSIQEAINLVIPGDTVVILPGTYIGTGNRDISFLGKAITVRSIDPNDSAIVAATVVDCQGSQASQHQGFVFNKGESARSVLAGLTITNAYRPSGGGVVCSGNSSPTISKCVFRGNEVTQRGGGFYNISGSPLIINCIFARNKAKNGGALYNLSNAHVVNCTFVNNSTNTGGGIHNQGGTLTLTNCILWNNTPSEVSVTSGSVSVNYTNVRRGFAGEGNISDDPLFADTVNGDYHLKSEYGRWNPNTQTWVVDDVTSPCIDAGDPNMQVGDEPFPSGVIINMGAYGGTKEASKSLSDILMTVNVNNSDNGSQVTLRQGQILAVTLESNPSTGYSWFPVEKQDSILEKFGDSLYFPSEQDDGIAGTGGWEILYFKSIDIGQETLKLVYRRSWETDVEPVKTFSIDVVVN